MVEGATVRLSPDPDTVVRQRAVIPFVLGVVAGALLVGLAVAALFWPRSAVVAQYTEPSTVTRPDGQTHYPTVREERSLWDALPGIAGQGRHHLVLGSDPAGESGHRLELRAMEVDTGSVRVTWTSDGARITYGTLDSDQASHEEFVPATFYRYFR